MAKKEATKIVITPPNFEKVTVRLEGVSPLMQNKFSEKARRQIEERQTTEDSVKPKQEPKDYEMEYNAARYISRQGWDGVPCRQIRAAMIRACANIEGIPMTRAKGAFFIQGDGFDKIDGTPLIKLEGKSQHDTRPVVLNGGTTDLRNRPIYPTWAIGLTVEYDADLCSTQDVANLLARAGMTIGIGELRPFGKKGFGGEYGMWKVVTEKKQARKRKTA